MKVSDPSRFIVQQRFRDRWMGLQAPPAPGQIRQRNCSNLCYKRISHRSF